MARLTSKWLGWLVVVAALILVALAVSAPRQSYVFRNFAEQLTLNQSEHILLLGRPGSGYGGSENTDSIIVLSLRSGQASLIYIPRDLLVPLRGETYKINSLFPLGFDQELLAEVSRIVGFPIRHYLAYDLPLVRRLINAMGGIEVNLAAPVTDAVSGYTLSRGRHQVDGEWAEFIVRSRYAPDGDFFRMRNQFAVVRGIRERLAQLPSTRVVQLVRVFEGSGRDYETDLSSLELLNFFSQLRQVNLGQVRAVILGFHSGLWRDGSFPLTPRTGNHGHAYGLVPQAGLGSYGSVQRYIRTELTRQGGGILIESKTPAASKIGTRTITPSLPVETITSTTPTITTTSAAVLDWFGETPKLNTTTIKQ